MAWPLPVSQRAALLAALAAELQRYPVEARGPGPAVSARARPAAQLPKQWPFEVGGTKGVGKYGGPDALRAAKTKSAQ